MRLLKRKPPLGWLKLKLEPSLERNRPLQQLQQRLRKPKLKLKPPKRKLMPRLRPHWRAKTQLQRNLQQTKQLHQRARLMPKLQKR